MRVAAQNKSNYVLKQNCNNSYKLILFYTMIYRLDYL